MSVSWDIIRPAVRKSAHTRKPQQSRATPAIPISSMALNLYIHLGSSQSQTGKGKHQMPWTGTLNR